jgi:hypothetical protein
MMPRLKFGVRFVVGALFFIGAAAFVTARVAQDPQQDLARARAATARYHDVDQAIADGYQNLDVVGCVPGEGCHFANFALVDCEFEPDRPEILLYAPSPGGNSFQLAGVEYVVPLACSADAPEGFAGDADEWREDSEGFGLWEMTAWLWLHNPDGMFAEANPRIQ